jgi:hypothetical protein
MILGLRYLEFGKIFSQFGIYDECDRQTLLLRSLVLSF